MPGVDRRVDDVLAVRVVVEVPLEHLQGSNEEVLRPPRPRWSSDGAGSAMNFYHRDTQLKV